MENKNTEEDTKEKTSDIYSKLFRHYIEFLPYYRVNLIELKDMHRWLRDIDFGSPLSDFSDFIIYMEWLSALNLLKPICVVNIPKPPEGTLKVISLDNIGRIYEEGLITFPEEIYNTKVTEDEFLKLIPWDHSKYELVRNDIQEGYISKVDKKKYFYHPLQFFNLLTYLGNIYKNLSGLKEYKEFYWKRLLILNNYKVKSLKDFLKEKGGTLEDYIKRQIESGDFFHQFLGILLAQNRWLTPKKLELWIKIETIFQPHIFKPSFFPDTNLSVQSHNSKDRESLIEEIENWYQNLENNLKNYFSKEDFHKVKEFRQKLELYLRHDGLENFIDLFLLIKQQKKDKLKGRLNLFVNMIEFVRVLKLAEDKIIREYPELEEYRTESRWYEPRFLFETEEEYIEYTKKVLLEYDLFQEDKFVVFVEGMTEFVLLEDWLKFIYSMTGVKISLKNLHGRRKAFIFEYIINNFEANDYFLVIDAEKPDYIASKKAELNGKGINEDSYYIFNPDFVTENFNIHEVLEAFKNYMIEIDDELSEGSKYELKDTFYEELEKELNSIKDKGFENSIENFMRKNTLNERFSLRKPKFAEKILEVMRANFSNRNRKTQYPFEIILGKFINEIDKRRFPKESS